MTPAPTRCPACDAGLKCYEPQTSDTYEGWEFACDALILRAENGKLFVENDCEIITTKAVDALNKAALTDSPQESGQ
jgi:hypothetical protein